MGISKAVARQLILIVLLSSTFVGLAAAQSVGRYEQTESNAGPYYYYVVPGSRTIQVSVIGAVQSPGLYEVNDGTSLGQLIALTGGPQMGARAQRTRRNVTVRLFRPNGPAAEPIYDSVVEEGSIYTTEYPPLREGDILRVDVVERARFNWRDALQIVTAAASTYLIVDRARN